MPSRAVKGCLFGCLAVPVLLVGIAVALPLLARAFARDPRPESATLSQPLPGAPTTAGEDGSATAPPLFPADGRELPAAGGPAARLELDLSFAEVDLLPGEPGEPIRVEADYDAARFALTEGVEEESATWTYRVRLRPRGGPFVLLGGSVRDGDNRVRIRVPPDHPLALSGRVRLARSELELGGLWLTEVDLELGTGDHTVAFSTPTRQPVTRMAVDASMGDITLRDLGNASPLETDVELSMGSMVVGLDGSWTRDGEVEVRTGMGDTRIVSPRDARLVIEDQRMALGEATGTAWENPDLPADAPEVRLRTFGRMGSARIE